MATSAADRVVADRYLLEAPLGRGGMGVVWRAHDSVLGRAVAVKEVVFPLSLPAAERRSAQARVMREARAAARLNHPGAVTLYDVVRDRDHTFIVMELVDAPTLADVVEDEGPLAPRRVAEIGAQLAGALEAAHRAGIVHRDVKPGNVMVPEDGGVKLADFGIASVQGDPRLTTTGLVMGSPAYMAPEQASGQPSGPPADLWALGATMYAAVEGEPPFDKGALIPTLAAVVNEDPRPMRRAGPLAPVIAALLSKDPGRRPTGPQVRAQLQPLTGASPTATDVLPATPAAEPEPPAEPAPEPAAEPERPRLLRPAVPAGGAGAPEEPGALPAGVEVGRPGRPRRGLLIGVVGLVAAAVLVAWLTDAVGPRREPPASTTGAAATRPPATTSQASPTRAPSTQAPSTRAPTTAAAGQLPAGWTSFNRSGAAYAVGVPPGWRERTRDRFNATVVEEERGDRRLTVRSTNPADPLPAASRSYRDGYASNLPGYRRLRFDEHGSYQGRPAVVFEYEFVDGGRRVHVRHVNFKGRTWGYNVELVTPTGQWAGSQELARQFEQAFRPLG
jgi:eukaryotic-like serine/threonine-protein kinase